MKIMDSGKDVLFLQVSSLTSVSNTVETSVESVIVSFILHYCELSTLDLWLLEKSYSCPQFLLPLNALSAWTVKRTNSSDIPQEIQNCQLPAIWSPGSRTCISGLCAVLRWSLKSQLKFEKSSVCKDLLGFRSGCLMSCSETSVWTKFCEVEFPFATNNFVKDFLKSQLGGSSVFVLPVELVRLETHFRKPVKTHNIRKRKQDILRNVKAEIQKTNCFISSFNENCESNGKQKSLNLLKKNNLSISDERVTEKHDIEENIWDLNHVYAEGIDMTLADLILFPCVHIIRNLLKTENMRKNVPLIEEWYKRLQHSSCVNRATRICLMDNSGIEDKLNEVKETFRLIVPEVSEESLYSRDRGRPKIKARYHEPSSVIMKFLSHGIEPLFKKISRKTDYGLDWSQLPAAVHPSGGDLPKPRLERKCQQLENMVWSVLDLAVSGQTIVDFCSGGGHLGLVLAYCLPQCKVVLVENKEASLTRARSRVETLGLQNVTFYQCNLGYYNGQFDIGVCLHACGVATDLVIKKCVEKLAAFVCCPCCYGFIHDTHLVHYPRSKKVAQTEISHKEYILLCHAADETEVDTPSAEQGKYCMGLVDTDRAFYAKEHDYTVTLSTLQPPSCTPKNNLLIGVPATW
ncbi:glutathione S-transferase C-terminal domain-containing protein isoform X1 [Tachypleus tridentatus]|uniref:glutathione S-transferase C-terminal domain-containing protein isoform X1 n=2 Tax=Tachypleus tridentatus TaxID=6853 RepID=UPI003FD028BB